MMSPMSDDNAELPAPIREANEAIQHQDWSMKRMLGGTAAMTALMFGSMVAGFDPGVVVGITGVFAWTLGNAAVMAPNAARWRTAGELMKNWRQRQLSQELNALDAPAPSEPEPSDPRWKAVSMLLSRVNSLGADDHVREVVLAVEGRLRTLLNDISVIDEAIAADSALGGETNERHERLESAKEAKETIAKRLIDCVRDLHVEMAVRDSGKADPMLERLESLVMQVEADAEVDGVGDDDERRRMAQSARKAQRES
jgi:hypothetical protein